MLPAFAETDSTVLYGDPANIQQVATPNTELPQIQKAQPDAEQIKEQTLNSKEITEQKVEEPKIKEKTVEKIKEKKTERQIKTESNQEQQQELQQNNSLKQEEQKFETRNVSNPDAKFPNGLQFGLGVSSTSGLNAFVGYNNKKFDSFWWKRFGVRLDFASYSLIKNGDRKISNNAGYKIYDDLKINNVDLNGHHFGAMVDFYPFGDTWFLGGLRVSGGYFTGNLDLNADIYANNDAGKFNFEIGGEKYYYEGEMKGTTKLNWKYSGPYLGTGFDLGLVAGLKLYFDAGVVFANKSADIDIDVPIAGLKDQITGNAVAESALKDAHDKAVADTKKELDKYPYVPIVKIGVMYRF